MNTQNENNPPPKVSANAGPDCAPAIGSVLGFWRSPKGENHGRDSRPGDVWIEPGDITDTDRVEWLIAGGYCPAEWRPATRAELNAGCGRKKGMIMIGMGSRKTIDAAILSSRNVQAHPQGERKGGRE